MLRIYAAYIYSIFILSSCLHVFAGYLWVCLFWKGQELDKLLLLLYFLYHNMSYWYDCSLGLNLLCVGVFVRARVSVCPRVLLMSSTYCDWDCDAITPESIMCMLDMRVYSCVSQTLIGCCDDQIHTFVISQCVHEHRGPKVRNDCIVL